MVLHHLRRPFPLDVGDILSDRVRVADLVVDSAQLSVDDDLFAFVYAAERRISDAMNLLILPLSERLQAL